MLPSASSGGDDRADRHGERALARLERLELRAHGGVLRLGLRRALSAVAAPRRRGLARPRGAGALLLLALALRQRAPRSSAARRRAPRPRDRRRRGSRAPRRRARRRPPRPRARGLRRRCRRSRTTAWPRARRRSAIRSQPAAGRPGLRRRLEHRADGAVVGVARLGRRRPARASASRSRRAVAAHDRAHLADRHVVLADVHAVGAAGERQLGPVVHDEQRAVRRAQRAQRAAGARRSRRRSLLVAQLHHVDAAAQRGLDGALGRRPRGRGRRARRAGARRRTRAAWPRILTERAALALRRGCAVRLFDLSQRKRNCRLPRRETLSGGRSSPRRRSSASPTRFHLPLPRARLDRHRRALAGRAHAAEHLDLRRRRAAHEDRAAVRV